MPELCVVVIVDVSIPLAAGATPTMAPTSPPRATMGDLDTLRSDPEREFEAVFDGHKARLYRVAFSVLRDRSEAEEAVQETMWKAWRAWPTLREPAKAEAWLTRICLNHCFRARRRLARTRPLSSLVSGERVFVEARGSVMAASTTARPADPDLDAAFKLLPPKQRAALLLHYHYGYTVDQCAEAMECREGTVRTHLNRALAKLRQELGDD